MPTIGEPAPAFDCTAVLDGKVVELDWRQLHENKILVLIFDAVESNVLTIQSVEARSRELEEVDRLQGKLAVVFRDHVFEILTWTDQLPDSSGTGDAQLPFIVDTDHWISSMYDMVAGQGETLWGHVIIDPIGRLRQVTMHTNPVETNMEELVRCLTSIRDEWSEAGHVFEC